MNTDIENAVAMARDEAQYDLQAKRLLGHKEILAHILIRTVPEFKGMKAPDVAKLIEGEVQVCRVPVEPGLTNVAEETDPEKGKRIVGLNTESGEPNEGTVRYDIVFDVRTPEEYGRKGRLMKVIVNVEMQKSDPTEYGILNRAIFYASRLISSQKGREFANDDYDGIGRVYSIWIVVGMQEHSLDHVHLTRDHLLGNQCWKGDLDLINIVMIGLSDELPEQGKEELELHRMLSALFSEDLPYGEKIGILKDEYRIDEDEGMRKEMTHMSNLGEGLVERTERRVTERVTASVTASVTEREQRRIIIRMHEDGDSNEKISRIVGRSLSDVQAIIAEEQPVTM